jgi:manganese oxidase
VSDDDARGSDAGLSRRSLLRGLAAGGAAGTLLGTGIGHLTNANATGPLAATSPQAASKGRLREYWLQVNSFQHNLAPSGRDEMMGVAVTGAEFWGLGYRAYTPNWGELLPGNDDIGPNAGIPGPTLRAEVGDRVRIHLRNNDQRYRWAHSLHAHGWQYSPSSDGAWTYAHAEEPGTAIALGDDYTYEYTVPADAVGTWPYHDHSVPRKIFPKPMAGMSHADMGHEGTGMAEMEIAAQLGMFGTIVVTDKHTRPVDHEIILFMHDMYQSDVPVLSQDFDCFNGRSFLSNTPEYYVKVGDRVRWRIVALGNEFHAFHIHGHRWFNGLRHVDSEIIGPSTTLDIEYTENNPGTWLYHCHVVEHMAGGMMGWYHVHK